MPMTAATMTAPSISVTLGPFALEIRADSGAIAIMTRPFGAMIRPTASMPCPSP